MKVTIISKTADAAELLIFTKNTRLEMKATGLEEIKGWSADRKAKELDYMATTIRSSWEFVDIVFMLEGVSRACAQQITRTRQASYAMQSQRVTDVRGAVVINTAKSGMDKQRFSEAANIAISLYASLVDGEMPLEDARGILPMNTACNLVAKYNLRALADLISARRSLRAQGEYNSIALEMEQCVLEVWPWAEKFFQSPNAQAIEMLERIAKEIGIKTGNGLGWEIAKAIDLLRKGGL